MTPEGNLLNERFVREASKEAADKILCVAIDNALALAGEEGLACVLSKAECMHGDLKPM